MRPNAFSNRNFQVRSDTGWETEEQKTENEIQEQKTGYLLNTRLKHRFVGYRPMMNRATRGLKTKSEREIKKKKKAKIRKTNNQTASSFYSSINRYSYLHIGSLTFCRKFREARARILKAASMPKNSCGRVTKLVTLAFYGQPVDADASKTGRWMGSIHHS